MGSSDVTGGDTIQSSDHNDLRDDLIDQVTAADEIFVGTSVDTVTVRTKITKTIAETGTEDIVKGFTALRVREAIEALGLTRIFSSLHLRTAAAASGDVIYTGAGFTPTGALFFALGSDSDNSLSFGASGVGLEDNLVSARLLGGAASHATFNSNVIMSENGIGGNYQYASLKTLDSDGLTLTWVKGSSGEQSVFMIVYFR